MTMKFLTISIIQCLFYVYILGPVSSSLNSKKDGHTDRSHARDHIIEGLNLGENLYSDPSIKKAISQTLHKLKDIYETSVKPLEDKYAFEYINKDARLANEINTKPMILMIGPWSVGKTTLINYMLGLEDSHLKQRDGPEPTTTDFVVLQHGDRYRRVQGNELVSDKSREFTSLDNLGLRFQQHLQSIEMPSYLLELVTLVDTPGILENRRQQDRGYPINEAFKWFMKRASLIFLIFDPTKLEVGKELEKVFEDLKGHDGKMRVILNKADIVSPQSLMKIYGALFWSLKPLINSVEPPRVYVGSFWSEKNTKHHLFEMFMESERHLLEDIKEVSENQVEIKISRFRTHALLVRIHALIVDSYLSVFEEHRSIIYNNEQKWRHILNNPKEYGVFERVLQVQGISQYDLPDAEVYLDFFTAHLRTQFNRLKAHCPYIFGLCPDNVLANAIVNDLTKLLLEFTSLKNKEYCTSGESCSN